MIIIMISDCGFRRIHRFSLRVRVSEHVCLYSFIKGNHYFQMPIMASPFYPIAYKFLPGKG